MLESSLTVAWFSWTNQNYFATYSNQWECFICTDNRLRQMALFVFVKVGRVRGKGKLSRYVERFWTSSSLFRLFIKTNRFHVVVRLYSNRSQMTSKCGKNIIDTDYHLVCHFFCSYHILTSSVIYYWTDSRQHGIYLLNRKHEPCFYQVLV